PMTLACICDDVEQQLVSRTTCVIRVRQVRCVRAILAFTERKAISRQNPRCDAPPGHVVNRDAREYHHSEHRHRDPVMASSPVTVPLASEDSSGTLAFLTASRKDFS